MDVKLMMMIYTIILLFISFFKHVHFQTDAFLNPLQFIPVLCPGGGGIFLSR